MCSQEGYRDKKYLQMLLFPHLFRIKKIPSTLVILICMPTLFTLLISNHLQLACAPGDGGNGNSQWVGLWTSV